MSRLIAGRYELFRLLGVGAHGEVWEARDRVDDDRSVAVKLLRPEVDYSPVRAQLEVAVLRMRLPGVVELRDDGVDDGRVYVVMELVVGSAFPSADRAHPWSEIADVTMALLESLASVHGASVTHRDLKPANVLVTAERSIKLLDFGLAVRRALTADRVTQRLEVVGTPQYMAPEQVHGKADARSDLYAVGVMLYEALAGKSPYEVTSYADILRTRGQRPPPLAQAAPEVPAIVAQIVDRLLAYEPADRPRSAAETLHLLRGEPSVEEPDFQWLGSQRALRALVDAVGARRSVDLIGASGVGRTRTLLAMQQALGSAHRVVWLTRADDAFASLAPVVGTLTEHAGAPFGEVRARVERDVRRALAEGTTIVADDAERIDRATMAVLAACRRDGSIVLVLGADRPPSDGPSADSAPSLGGDESIDASSLEDAERIVITPLRERHLRTLFAGPDRLLHLREDAARVLHRRTEGLPGKVIEEVGRWVRLGIAQWSQNHLVVTREGIEAIEHDLLPAAPAEATEAALKNVTEGSKDLLAWLTLAWPHTSAGLLAQALGKPRFRVEANLAWLLEAGLVERQSDDAAPGEPAQGERYRPRIVVSAATRWTPERLREGHDTLVRLLPPGAIGRLSHVFARGAGTDEDRRAIAGEAAALGERLIDEGRLQPAVATLDNGLRQVRDQGPRAAGEVARLLALWVEAAIESGTEQALDRVLTKLSLTQPRTDFIAQLEELVHAAKGAKQFGPRPLEQLQRVPRFEDPRLERVRLSVRVKAVKHLESPPGDGVLGRKGDSLVPPGEPDAEADLINHRGRLFYGQGRFREAAALHREAASKARSALLRTYSSFSAALASMDAFAFDEARAWAGRAAQLARSQRHAYNEALAAWVLRSVAYREGTAGDPDLELTEAAAVVGAKHIEGLIAFNEAVVAHRQGKRALAVELASRADRILSAIGEPDGVPLVRCLLILLGEPVAPEQLEDLVRRVRKRGMPGIGIQALALLAMAGKLAPGSIPPADVAELAGQVPREHWDTRMDVLSISECRAALE
jgi:tRNA A-37 threonylcarbamoyl transferase component Bud32/tetratricopeptide (TPR) repeat protein